MLAVSSCMRMIDCSGWCRLPGRLAAWVFTEVGVHIRFRGHGGLGFRPYGGSLGKAPSNQGLLPLSYGGSPRLAIPSLRSCSVGSPPSAIHGRGRLPRHPCRGAHCAEPPLGLPMGRCIKIKNKSEAACRPAYPSSPLPHKADRCTAFAFHHASLRCDPSLTPTPQVAT